MLLPHELKNRTFSRVLRGYSVNEVDDYVDFLVEKYTEVYRENDELERKLKASLSKLDEMKNNEQAIQNTLLRAQKTKDELIKDGNERAELIVRSAKSHCDDILAEFGHRLKIQKEVLLQLQQQVRDFKSNLYAQYNESIGSIEKLSKLSEENLVSEVDISEYENYVIDAVKKDIIKSVNTENGSYEEDFDDDVEPSIISQYEDNQYDDNKQYDDDDQDGSDNIDNNNIGENSNFEQDDDSVNKYSNQHQ